jgi:hypothetical protein
MDGHEPHLDLAMSFEAAKRTIVDGPLDWLAAVVLSWLVPLGLLPFVPVTYLTSLVLWLVPIILLLPRFLQKSTSGGRRRRALSWTAAYIVVGGLLLDLVFGSYILKFGSKYLFMVPAVREPVPVEEILFYISGGIAIVLVYFWADEHWLHAYNVRQGREMVPERGRLLHFSGRSAILALMLFLLGAAIKSSLAGGLRVPYYFTFLIAVAFIPAMALFRNTKHFVNWKAFSFTTLYVLLTSCIWEATLALKRKWWGYREEGMLGINIDDWGTEFSTYPIEALLVWLVVTFSCVLTYEAVKVYQYDPRPGMKQRLTGKL